MIQGLDTFRDFFQDFKDHYTLIGGMACHLSMEDAGIDFRATKDLDIVLAAEVLNAEFVQRFWGFVKAGGYQLQERSSGEKQFYRFSKPSNPNYPAMLELFSRQLDGVILEGDATLTPIPMDEDVSSLSAILLDENYYGCIQDGRIMINDISVLSVEYIIPFKMRAFLDMTSRKAAGGKIDTKNINKHKNDVIKIAQLLSPAKEVVVPEEIKQHMRAFIDAIKSDVIDMKSLGITGVSVIQTLDLLRRVYALA